jgi:5'-nucleotidase
VKYNKKHWDGIAANASPALTVEHAIKEVAHRPIDLVVSGINYGENVGSCVTVSGTIGAALEAADCGIPSLAVSLETFGSDYHSYNSEVDFNTAACFTKIVAEKMLSSALPDDVDVLKLEVPASATKDTQIVIARQDKIAYYTVEMEKRLDTTSAGKFKHAALKGQFSRNDTDAFALAQGLVCITPLSLNLTSRVPLEKLGEILEFENLIKNGE